MFINQSQQMSFLALFVAFTLGISTCFAKEAKNQQNRSSTSSFPRVGELVPDFKLQDRKGRWHKLSDFRGSVVFLNFWATWCPPCVDELPVMDALNQRYKAKNFTMVGVSVDDDWETVNEFFQDRGKFPSFLVLLDSKKDVTTLSYGTSKFPETYIIGPTGILLKKYIGAFNWLSADKLDDIDNFLSKKTQ